MTYSLFPVIHRFAGVLLIALLMLSQTALADAISDGDKGIEEYRRGNLIEAMLLLESSAQQGYAPAQVTLGYILDHSEQNEAAFHWYQQAAEQNNPGGLFGLGVMYEKGEGTDKDQNRAGVLFKKSAEMDYVPAMRALANALEFGRLGLNRNEADALIWYTKAAEAGDDVSMRRLINAYRNGQLGLPVDAAKAAEWEDRINTREDNKNDE